MTLQHLLKDFQEKREKEFWRMAKSAPKTGEHILVTDLRKGGFGYCKGEIVGKKEVQDWVAVVHYWDYEPEKGFYLSTGEGDKIHFTHWMPLPIFDFSQDQELIKIVREEVLGRLEARKCDPGDIVTGYIVSFADILNSLKNENL